MQPTMATDATAPKVITFDDLLSKAKDHLSMEQVQRITALENSVIRGDVQEQKLHMYHQLATFWRDSAHVFEPYAYYTAEAAKLDNSEKSLTFAAQLFVDNLLSEQDMAMAHWWASNAKVLLEKDLEINPNNDSSKISLGACYILGGVSDNPMQGILPVKAIADKNPDNLYAQLILGLGGQKSGQFDKAIEHFTIILHKDPNNFEVMLHLAECYDSKGDKANAIHWYGVVRDKVSNEDVKKELGDRIKALSTQ